MSKQFAVVYDTQPTEHGQRGYPQHSTRIDADKLKAFLPDAYQEWLFRARDNIEHLRLKQFIADTIGSWKKHTPESHVFAMLGHHPSWAVLLTDGDVVDGDTQNVIGGKVVKRDQAEYEAQEQRRADFRERQAKIDAEIRRQAEQTLIDRGEIT